MNRILPPRLSRLFAPLGAAALALACAAVPASAQPIDFFGPRILRPPRPVYAPMPAWERSLPMPPSEARLAARDEGFEDIGRIVLRDDIDEIAALDPRGRPVLVRLDAFDGDILSVTPSGKSQPPAVTRKPAPPRGSAAVPARQPVAAAAKPAPLPPTKPLPAYPPPAPKVLEKKVEPARPATPPVQGFE